MKKLILPVMTVLILLLLAGCGGGTGPDTTETSLSDGSTNTTEAKGDSADEGDEGKADEGSDEGEVDTKALFEVTCSGCHGWDEPGLLISEGKNAALKGQFLKHPKRLDWTDTVKRMRTNGMEVTDEELEAITEYLNQNWRA